MTAHSKSSEKNKGKEFERMRWMGPNNTRGETELYLIELHMGFTITKVGYPDSRMNE